MSIERVGVIGAGQMGAGIAEVSARAGVDVLVYEPTEALTTAGRNRIVKSVERGVSAGKITERERDAAVAKLKFTTDLAQLADRQLVIEAVLEDESVKAGIFAELDRVITDLMRVVGIESYDHETPFGRLLRDAVLKSLRGGPGASEL